MISSLFVANAIFMPICGRYLESLGSRKFLYLGLILLGIGNGCIGLLEYVSDKTTFFTMSILLRTISALGDSMASPASFALIARQVGPSNQGMK